MTIDLFFLCATTFVMLAARNWSRIVVVSWAEYLESSAIYRIFLENCKIPNETSPLFPSHLVLHLHWNLNLRVFRKLMPVGNCPREPMLQLYNNVLPCSYWLPGYP